MTELIDQAFHPDFEWHPGIVGLSRISYTGRDEFRAYLGQMAATARRVELRDWSVKPAGQSHALLTGELVFESHDRDHLAFEAEYAVVYRIEDGLLRSGRSYPSIAEATDAALEVSDAAA
jgi:ketosteroid isomerase-like protein